MTRRANGRCNRSRCTVFYYKLRSIRAAYKCDRLSDKSDIVDVLEAWENSMSEYSGCRNEISRVLVNEQNRSLIVLCRNYSMDNTARADTSPSPNGTAVVHNSDFGTRARGTTALVRASRRVRRSPKFGRAGYVAELHRVHLLGNRDHNRK